MSTLTSSIATGCSSVVCLFGEYLKTLPGQLKLICMVFDLAGFICIQVSQFNHLFSGEFFSTVSMICFVFTAVLFLLYVFRVVNKLEHIPWLKIEMWFCAVTVLIFLVASVLVSCERTWTFLAAAICGFSAMCVYGGDTFLKYRTLRGDVNELRSNLT